MHIVFGGSFNPPTKAHVHIVKFLLNRFPQASVIVVPVGDDYRKPELAPFLMRMEMLTLAFQGENRVMISSIEDERGYQGTLRTLDDLSKHYQDLHFVIGSDNISDLPNWINYRDLLAKYPFIVMKRQGFIDHEEAESLLKDIPHRFIYVDFDDPSASTKVRKNIDKYHHLLDDNVYEYIKKHHIYEVKSHV
ncbi:MAG TPA: nicotinate (nicotinamide) nucleotide adenylyltransferase [Acholeplasmataceae bacterium]|nr:nicotinate (nicotinamide) nucleotide adenylyltransferase [Acholeplasmataceae bacterium]